MLPKFARWGENPALVTLIHGPKNSEKLDRISGSMETWDEFNLLVEPLKPHPIQPKCHWNYICH